jgi:hypothetical protein
MCILAQSVPAAQTPPPAHPAHALTPPQRQQLAREALAGQTITALAQQHQVSRKFVYQQRARADQALRDAFAPLPTDDQVLFYLPVTKAWLQQLILALVLIGHSPLRGVVELLRDLFDYSISLGTVFNIVQAAVTPAQHCNRSQDLRNIRVGGHDEIFQGQQPVLVGVDLLSSYCYLLSCEEQRDADTWGVHLLELQEQGFDPDYVVADGSNALRAAQAEILPDTPCRSDVFHVVAEVQKVVTKLENRAYRALTTCVNLAKKQASFKKSNGHANGSYAKQLSDATPLQDQAIALADDVAVLGRWLRDDIVGLAGAAHADRLTLYDFVCAELAARVAQASELLSKLVSYLKSQRDDVLAFAAQLDGDLATLAATWSVSTELVRELFAVQQLAADNPRRWPRDAALRQLLGARYHPLSVALEEVQQRTVRASSMVENLNSRLRSYFFLRRHLGKGYLSLLQFFLNHCRYVRSEHRDRVDHSPTELLTGESHPHWLELLGYKRFSRS